MQYILKMHGDSGVFNHVKHVCVLHVEGVEERYNAPQPWWKGASAPQVVLEERSPSKTLIMKPSKMSRDV
jgi:hypothetical protein